MEEVRGVTTPLSDGVSVSSAVPLFVADRVSKAVRRESVSAFDGVLVTASDWDSMAVSVDAVGSVRLSVNDLGVLVASSVSLAVVVTLTLSVSKSEDLLTLILAVRVEEPLIDSVRVGESESVRVVVSETDTVPVSVSDGDAVPSLVAVPPDRDTTKVCEADKPDCVAVAVLVRVKDGDSENDPLTVVESLRVLSSERLIVTVVECKTENVPDDVMDKCENVTSLLREPETEPCVREYVSVSSVSVSSNERVCPDVLIDAVHVSVAPVMVPSFVAEAEAVRVFVVETDADPENVVDID